MSTKLDVPENKITKTKELMYTDFEQTEPVEMKLVCLEELLTNPAQPPQRTTESALATLIAAMYACGIISPITVLRKQVRGQWVLYIGDGHRRVEAAKKLGVELIWAVIYEASERAEKFWCYCNITKPINGKHWLTSWAIVAPSYRAKHLESFPRMQRELIKDCIVIWGEDRLVEIGRAGEMAPVMAKLIIWTVDQLNGTVATNAGLKRVTPRRVGDWALKYRQFLALRTVRTEQGGMLKPAQVKAVHKAITEGRPWKKVKAATR